MLLPGYFFWWGIYLMSVLPLVILPFFFNNSELQVLMIFLSLIWGVPILALYSGFRRRYFPQELIKQEDDVGHIGDFFDRLPLFIIIVNQEGAITYINNYGADFLDLPRQEVVGKNFRECIGKRIVLDSSLELSDFITDTLDHRIAYEEVPIGAWINGVKGTVQLTTFTLYRKECFRGVFVMLSDDKLSKLFEEKIERNECLTTVGQMAAGICHEIRNPLQSIKGFVQLLEEENRENENLQVYGEIIINEIDRTNGIIQEFLQLAKPTSTKFQRKDLNALVREVVLLMSSEALMQNVVIEAHFDEKIPLIPVDESRMKQVLINLFSNAFGAIPASGLIQIATEYDELLKEVKIVISDNGTGMDPETLACISKPFFTTKEEGTGLGLPICFSIIADHKGQILVESIIGQGTSFTIILPESEKFLF
jgi:signal transduction histidine kinase